MPAIYVPDDYISEIDLVLNTIGISTKELTFWEKILFLVRLIPLCEANYNLMELGGNGIGKTKTYSMFSPECEIVQEMLVTEIIYNRQSKEKGLLATKDVIVFDEIDKIKLDADKEKIIPQLLNYMADGQTTSPRKLISKASLVFSGNVMGIQERIEKKEKNVFDNAHKLEDNAFFDRIHFFLPAWGLRRYSKNIHGENIDKKVFRFDYFSKVLNLLRNEDYSKIIDEKGYTIETNPFFRFDDVYSLLLNPDAEIENKNLKESLLNITLHLLGNFDLYVGQTKKDFYCKEIVRDMESGAVGEKVRNNLLFLNMKEKLIIAEVFLEYDEGRNQIKCLKKIVKKFFSESIV